MRKKILMDELSQIAIPSNFVIPVQPSYEVKSLNLEKCKFMDSFTVRIADQQTNQLTNNKQTSRLVLYNLPTTKPQEKTNHWSVQFHKTKFSYFFFWIFPNFLKFSYFLKFS